MRCSQIEVFFEEDCIDNLDEVLDAWATSASWALLPQTCMVWSTHRWVSNIDPLCKATLLDAVHDIKRDALQIYLAKTAMEKDNKQVNVSMVEGQLVLRSSDESQTFTASQLWSALNSQTRKNMRQVCKEATTAKQLVMCVASGPMVASHRKLLKVDSNEWELEQQARLSTGTRSFKLVEAAKGNLTAKFWAD